MSMGTGSLSARSLKLDSGFSLNPRPEVPLAGALAELPELLVLRLILKLNFCHNAELCLGAALTFDRSHIAHFLKSAADVCIRSITSQITNQALRSRSSTPAASLPAVLATLLLSMK